MRDQIVVLLALTAGLFDPIPLEAMVQAEQAVRDAAGRIAPELGQRLMHGDTLAPSDRDAMVALARDALTPWAHAVQQPAISPADSAHAAAPLTVRDP